MSQYLPVGIAAHPTSSALTPAETLDPELFDGEVMKPDARMSLLSAVHGFMDTRFGNSQQWLRTWLAGSGASYRWHAALDVRDLDVLLGIDFILFRKANPGFAGVGNAETAQYINDMLRRDLWPAMAQWRGQYETTFYALQTSDINTIHPYAAYDLDQNAWTVKPTRSTHRAIPQEWEHYADLYKERAERAVKDYARTLTEVHGATSPAHRTNAEARFRYSVGNASDLYQAVHQRRGVGFSTTGEGYDDLGNFLWQRGKAEGWIPALRQIHDYRRAVESSQQAQTYGMELPTHDLLVQRAALRYGSGD